MDSRTRSFETLVPHFESHLRFGSVTGAVINLISTVIGGGVLSLPFALRHTGLVPGLILLFATAVASDYSVYTLVSCSRRSGAQSFEDVAGAAFGRYAKSFCTGLMIAVTFIPLVAYLILMRDLVSPIVELYIVGHEMTRTTRNLVAVALAIIVTPACLLQSLNGLKTLSLVSIIAIIVLGVALMTRSVECVDVNGWGSVNAWPRNGVSGVLQGIAIFVCAFICHFNVLPVHCELERPSRRRLHRMVHWTMGLVCSLYTIIGLAGYFYSTCHGGPDYDNILNSFDPDDGLINLGRAGLIVTVMLSFPLLVVPCRATLLRACKKAEGTDRVAAIDIVELERPLLNDDGCVGDVQINSTAVERSSSTTICKADENDQPLRQRIVLTSGIMALAMAMATGISQVSDVWAVLGSSVNLIVAFIVPCAAYLRIRKHSRRTTKSVLRIGAAVFLLWLAVILAFVCTSNTLYIIGNRWKHEHKDD